MACHIGEKRIYQTLTLQAYGSCEEELPLSASFAELIKIGLAANGAVSS
jgi:hypothetical protein